MFAAATLKDSEPIFESFQGYLSWISTGYFGKLHPQLEQEVVMIEREEEEEEEEEKEKEKETESHENDDENDNDDDMEKAQQRKRRENSIRTRKNKALVEALRKRKEYKSLVFANSQVEADEIVEYLNTNTDING